MPERCASTSIIAFTSFLFIESLWLPDWISDEPCTVVDPISDSEIVCDTPADSSGANHYAGKPKTFH